MSGTGKFSKYSLIISFLFLFLLSNLHSEEKEIIPDGFTADFPGKLLRFDRDDELDETSDLLIYTTRDKETAESYTVTVINFKDKIDSLEQYNKAIEEYKLKWKLSGTITPDRPDILYFTGKGNMFFFLKIVITEKTLYEISVYGYRNDYGPERKLKFFDSFEIIDKDDKE